ncbi:hypothetical protein LAZ67_1001579 [Cordylochernes scorpioides]|uniref:Integrase catalytic domain-containing protein n=1 Tax=Cordylochernes scorpioides TaxID=51811 RepID=A0ABY6JX46_9ARAC|nr:hypothetical protein LAZ67_1001579 [Cordylochernes scorpioides]
MAIPHVGEKFDLRLSDFRAECDIETDHTLWYIRLIDVPRGEALNLGGRGWERNNIVPGRPSADSCLDPLDVRGLPRALDSTVERTSKIYGLTPFLDDQGILRIGDRLKRAPSMTYEQKHPVLLPATGKPYADSARKCALDAVHIKIEVLDTESKRSGEEMHSRVRYLLSIQSRHSRPTNDRFTQAEINTRVETEGPKRITSVYLCVCFVARAEHLELVTYASTPTFLSAFKLFVARRRHFTRLFIDQGINFVESTRQLRSCFYMAQKQFKYIAAVLVNEETKWKFNPP